MQPRRVRELEPLPLPPHMLLSSVARSSPRLGSPDLEHPQDRPPLVDLECKHTFTSRRHAASSRSASSSKSDAAQPAGELEQTRVGHL